MNKLDTLRHLGKSNVTESMLGPAAGTLPPGIRADGAVTQPPHLVGVTRDKGAVHIALDRIEPDPDQPRREFDEEELRRLADSLKARGQLQPIRVRWEEGRGVYVILVGERRWRAARLAGMESISCTLHEGRLAPQDRLIIQLTENALREDLKPVEQARAFQALIEVRGYTQRELAAELHVSLGCVTRALSLLQLPGDIQEVVDAGMIPPTAAHEISKAHPDDRADLAERVISGTMRTEDVARTVRESAPRKTRRTQRVTSRVFRTKAGPKVTVEWSKGLSPSVTAAALGEAADTARDYIIKE